MKNKIISSTLLLIGFFLGATALSTLAATWTTPSCNPSTSGPGACNTEAPVHVGSTGQSKLGPLLVNTASVLDDIGLTITGKIKLDDIRKGAGKVLTSDADGVGTWQTPGNLDISSLCNSIQTGTSPSVTSINLIKNGKNICSDNNGCSIRLLDTNGTLMSTPPILLLMQTTNGNWRDNGNGSGLNGDSSASPITNSSVNFITLYDDVVPTTLNNVSGITETAPDQINVIRYGNNGYNTTVSVCDF
ncbi:MAG: hypothetical protein KBC33_01170 [Candidatus Pacebacteria bacterium]|nr:hypothetical protein [Candidatus Paceibacterota bacterium]